MGVMEDLFPAISNVPQRNSVESFLTFFFRQRGRCLIGIDYLNSWVPAIIRWNSRQKEIHRVLSKNLLHLSNCIPTTFRLSECGFEFRWKMYFCSNLGSFENGQLRGKNSAVWFTCLTCGNTATEQTFFRFFCEFSAVALDCTFMYCSQPKIETFLIRMKTTSITFYRTMRYTFF
jgi:hypothetical protein